jgi:hypothetical protein
MIPLLALLLATLSASAQQAAFSSESTTSSSQQWTVFHHPIKRVAVIGAGPAGLQAAAKLVEHNFTVRLFERAPLPGGNWCVCVEGTVERQVLIVTKDVHGRDACARAVSVRISLNLHPQWLVIIIYPLEGTNRSMKLPTFRRISRRHTITRRGMMVLVWRIDGRSIGNRDPCGIVCIPILRR